MYTIKELKDLAEETMIVYKIINLVNGKIYIGQTTRTFNLRYSGAGVGAERVKRYYETHGSAKNEHLYNSFIKYGTDKFKVEIVAKCETEEELNKKEKELIALYNSNDYKKGYNIEEGGDNKRRSLEWRVNRILKGSDVDYFINLVKNNYIEKDDMFDLLNSPVVYIKKNGGNKQYYYYSNIRLCCLENGLSVEDGFCIAMRKRDGSRKNKNIYHHVHITKHEIWFASDINIDIKEINFKNKKQVKTKNKPSKTKKTKKKVKESTHKNYQPKAKICPICGKEYKSYSHTNICADCTYNLRSKLCR